MTNYYVKNTGSDAANGWTDDTAWQTINKINTSSFNPGDTILFNKGDVWRETLTIPSSGNAGAYIVFTSYGDGSEPKILGSIQAITWEDQGSNIWKSSTSVTDPYSGTYPTEIFFEELDESIVWGHVKKANTSLLVTEHDWTWSGNYIYVYATSDPDSKYISVEVPQRNIIISLNDKEYIELTGLKVWYGKQINIKGLYPASEKHGLKISYCDIAYVGRKQSTAGFGLNFYHSDVWIHHNDFHDCGRRNFSVAIAYDGSSSSVENVIVEDNHFYNPWYACGPDFECEGDHSIRNITIRRNLIESDPNIIIDRIEGFDVLGVWFQKYDGVGTFTELYFYDNIITYTSSKGVGIENVQNAYFYNNTFYGVQPTTTIASAFIWIGRTGILDLYVKNNIFYNDANPTNVPLFKSVYVNPNCTFNSLDDNLYYTVSSTAKIAEVSNTTYTQSQWATYKTITGYETHSPTPADPSFVSSSDYHLQAGSPAIGAGINVDLTTDYAGNLWNATPSIGAYEYGSSSTTTLAPTTTSDGFTLIEGTWLENRTALNAMYQRLYQRFGL